MTWLDRQSFLGAHSDEQLESATVGLVGLGGGNSHVAQQLAHLGVGGFVLLDDDLITLTNLNRLVGGTAEDVRAERPKTEIAARVIRAVNPDARIVTQREKWQVAGDLLKGCDVIVGGLDHVGSKDELEAFCRRFMIPYIDMGMDVTPLPNSRWSLVSGQVVLSTPGEPCLRCLQVITDETLKLEAQRYGVAGSRPQVVWPNGVLASTAVGLVVQLLTPWLPNPARSAYLVYDANLGTVTLSERLSRRRGKPCPHYPAKNVGDPLFDVRRYLERLEQPVIPTASPQARQDVSSWTDRLFAGLRRVFRHGGGGHGGRRPPFASTPAGRLKALGDNADGQGGECADADPPRTYNRGYGAQRPRKPVSSYQISTRQRYMEIPVHEKPPFRSM